MTRRGGEQVAQIASVFGERGKMLYDTWVFSAERRQHNSAHARTQKARVVVAGVGDTRKPMLAEVGADVSARYIDERAYNSVTPPGQDARKPIDPRAAHESVEHGLGLVIERMTDRNTMGALLPRARQKSLITGLARVGLTRRASRHGYAQREERNAERRCEVSGHGHIAVRVGAKAMIDRRSTQAHTQLGRERVKHVQEHLRIRTTRASDEDALALGKQLALSNRAPHLGAHTRGYVRVRGDQNVPESRVTRVEVRAGKPKR